MRKFTQVLLVLGGGALAIAGFLQDNGWMVGIGGVPFMIGVIMWIASPRKPDLNDVGNRPTYDVTQHGGPGPQA